MKRFFFFFMATALIPAFCGCSDDDGKKTTGPVVTEGIAVVSTGGDNEANISVIDYINNKAWNDLLPVSGSCELTQYGRDVFIIDKSGDRIIKFDPYTRTAIGELSTGPGSAPESIAFVSSTKAYVTMSDSATVKVFNPSIMTASGSIDLSPMADSDDDPDQGHGVIKNGRLYVSLRRSSGRNLTDYSSVAVIDIATDTVVGEIVLSTNGIAGASKLCLGGQVRGTATVEGAIYPYIIGSVSDPADGAVEIIDTASLTSQVIMTEAEIGGNITTWVFDTAVTGYAIVGLSDRSGGEGWGLRRFDLTAHTFTPVSIFQRSYYSWSLDVTSDGLVLVGSSDENNPGVWVFDPAKGYDPVFETPIGVGLLPERILAVR